MLFFPTNIETYNSMHTMQTKYVSTDKNMAIMQHIISIHMFFYETYIASNSPIIMS